MKTERNDRYLAAVERNLANVEQRKSAKYVGKGVEEARVMLGIRLNDQTYDNRILKIIKTKV